MYRVILPGEALIDRFTIKGKTEDKPGGAPANVAAAVAKIGIDAEFVGTVGNDENGLLLQKTMQANGVGVSHLVFKDTPTTIANVSIDEEGERAFTFIRGADGLLSFNDLSVDLLQSYGILHLGSATALLGGELYETYIKLLDDATSNKKIVVFDPNYRESLFGQNKDLFKSRSLSIIAKSTIVKVSIEELELLVGHGDVSKGAKELNAEGAKYVLVTLGAKGTLLSTKESEVVIPSVRVKQIDTTGAGDSFIGYMIGQLAKEDANVDNIGKIDMNRLIRKSNICASITVSRIGALESIPTQREVEEIFKENQWN